jgi:hypothetical protein
MGGLPEVYGNRGCAEPFLLHDSLPVLSSCSPGYRYESTLLYFSITTMVSE